MRACTHRPSLLFSQTATAISMRKTSVRSQSTAARASAAPCGFPHREGDHRSDWGRERGGHPDRSQLCLVLCLLLKLLFSYLYYTTDSFGHSFFVSKYNHRHLLYPHSSLYNTPGVKMKSTSTAAGDQAMRTRLTHFSQLGSKPPTPWSHACLSYHVKGVVLVGCWAWTISQLLET